MLTTAPDRQSAQQLAQQLVAKQWAACVQLTAIDSVYAWEGEIRQEPEILLLIKTRQACYENIEQHIRATHSYSVPEIIQLPITNGSSDYLRWLSQTLSATH
ncbi:MAG: divalent-cation tolerance protein CutA [Pseudomonadales bacterium]|nr:divalent-cation tolerance protein CutA [Pseudomonadales bacterium]